MDLEDSEGFSCDVNIENVHNMFTKTIFDIQLMESKKYIIEEGLSLADITIQKILEEINNAFDTCEETVESDVLSKIAGVQKIVQSLTSLLTHLLEMGETTINDSENIPKSIGAVLLMIFSHFKDCEHIYSTKTATLGKNVMELFKNCHELQTKYLTLLTEQINFDLEDEWHLELLEEVDGLVLDIIVDIGGVVITLDAKTMAQEWKGYTGLCEKYAIWLKDTRSTHKATKILCNELKNNVQQLVSNKIFNTKDVTRLLKISNFILKILIKLAELFNGSLTNNIEHVLSCLELIYNYSVPNLLHTEIKPNIIEGIRSHIFVGTELLLAKLISDSRFQEEYVNYSTVDDKTSQLGYLLIGISIAKMLLHESEEIKNGWTDDIVSVILRIVDQYNEEFLRNMKFSCGLLQNLSLYDYLLLNIACLIISTEDLSRIEEELTMRIFRADIWSPILARDIFIIISKYGPPELCYQYLLYFTSNFHKLNRFNYLENTPQYCYLTHLIANLYAMLPDKYKLKYYDTYPCKSNLQIWNEIGLQNLPSEIKNEEHKSVLESCKKGLTEIRSIAELKGTLKMVLLICDDVQNNEDRQHLSNQLLKLWRMLILNGKFESILKIGSQWLFNFVALLCRVTENMVNIIMDDSWIEILQIASTLMVKSPPFVKLSILKLAQSFVHREINDNSQSSVLISILAWTFDTLMTDRTDLVSVVAIREFKYFILNAVSEKVVVHALKDKDELKSALKKLLKKQTFSANAISADGYYNQTIHYKHSCKGTSQAVAITCSPNVIDQDPNTDRDIDRCLHVLEDEAFKLSSLVVDRDLNEQQLWHLQRIKDALKMCQR